MVMEAAYRPISVIAEDVAREWRQMPRDARRCLDAVGALEGVIDRLTYQAVAEVRCQLGPWRGNTARRIKAELETILAHYRSAHED